MKENQNLFLKTLFICTFVLSCTNNDVRQINTSNQLIKTNQTITLNEVNLETNEDKICLLYTSPSPRDRLLSRMPSSA